MKKTDSFDEEIKVSILCTVFNHEAFLRKCLDGFIEQITDFKYEIIVHDDCSTDASIKIIKEYTNKYSNIIAIYENENQYSKGINITREIMFPLAKGKYIALCDGDDCWIDQHKLQKQFEFMESHQECSLCSHNTLRKDLSNIKKDVLFNNWKECHVLNENDTFFTWKIHYSSYFCRYDSFDYQKSLPSVWCGDYAHLVFAFTKGLVVALPDVMSVYHSNNKNGVTYTLKDAEKMIIKDFDKIHFLVHFNRYTKFQYESSVIKEICVRIKEILLAKMFIEMRNDMTLLSYWKARRKISKTLLYKIYFKKADKIAKFKGFLIFHSYILFLRTKYKFFRDVF